ncbi:MAG TPA: malonate decarboxylase holo-[acyl-carrier-protein] synthase [Methylovirgula sp.]
MRRHDLVRVDHRAWEQVMRARPELAAEPLVRDWVSRDWPLVARRRHECESGFDSESIPLGLPLPPGAGKRRLSFVFAREAVVAISPPVALASAIRVAPAHWRNTLERLQEICTDLRVFGSLGWMTLTGLSYLNPGSDLDLLMPLIEATDTAKLLAGLRALDIEAPMRLDGEIVRGDGAAVNWRELDGGSGKILVKSLNGAVLVERDVFLAGT